MSVRIELAIEDAATIPLQRAIDRIQDKAQMHQAIGARCRDLTSRYITEIAAPKRHKTADRLGAGYTNYLVRAGQSVIARGDSDGAELTIPQNGAIFARVAGPVMIKPVTKKWLTMPISASSYGRRARELEGLTFIKTKAGNAFLVRRPKYQKKADGTRRTKAEAEAYRAELKAQTTFLYALRKEVTLKGDRGLLPSDQQYFEAIKNGVIEVLEIENPGAGAR